MAKKNSIFKEIGLELARLGRGFVDFFRDRNNVILLFCVIIMFVMWGSFMYHSLSFDKTELIKFSISRCRDLSNEKILSFMSVIVSFSLFVIMFLGESINYKNEKSPFNKKVLLRNAIVSFFAANSIMLIGLVLVSKWC